jgi:hypothetical protein
MPADASYIDVRGDDMKRWERAMGAWRRVDTCLHSGLQGVRLLCCLIALAALGYGLFRVGTGVLAVTRGEMTSAQMLEGLGVWLRGFEK